MPRMAGTLYDRIGKNYAAKRRADPSISRAIQDALGAAESVVNVGAGTGSYEPIDRFVVAVEPSATMNDQRAGNSSLVVRATASALPFRSKSFDAALAVLTVHHWRNQETGLHELRRVVRKRIVVFTWDPAFPGFWLTDYFPEILDIDRPIFPGIEDFDKALGTVDVVRVPIAHDCADGFLCAFWRRPEAYLDPAVRAGMSTFAKIRDVDTGVARLERDLMNGTWQDRHGRVLEEDRLDLGYRLILADV